MSTDTSARTSGTRPDVRPTTTRRPADARRNADVRRTLLAAAASLLGAVTLKSLLRDNGWIVDVVLSIAVVVVPALLLRLRRPPSALDVWPGVVLLVPWLTARFLSDHALAGVIPTPGTMHALSALMTDLHHTTRDEIAPIHSTPAVRLVLCALVGLLAALVDLIAVVGRRGALAGIPLLVVYTVSGAVSRHAVAWGWFVAAAFGFLLLLSLDAADDRAGWGHRVRASDASRPSRSGDMVTRSAPRLGVVAIVLAVLIPLVLPVQSTNLLAKAFQNSGHNDRGFGASDGGGGSISPFAKLRDQLNRGTPTDMATVHITGPSTTVPFYLRVNVLDRYTDAGWSVSDHGTSEDIQDSRLEALPADSVADSNAFEASIKISGLSGNAPLFASLEGVEGPLNGTTWSPQDQLLLGSDLRRGTTITEQVRQPAPSINTLNDSGPALAADVSRWLVKPTLPPYVTKLVGGLVQGAGTPYAKARKISNYFADPANDFSYSLQVPLGDSGSQLVDFLKAKQGFCQQYAAAMAIMLRQANVPSRVVLGYMHAPADSKGNFTVTTNDAHAWVEAYFVGVGWIPFDPTPTAGLTGGPKSDLAWAPHEFPKTGGAADQTRPTVKPSTASGKVPTSSASSQRTAQIAKSADSGSALPFVITVAAVLLLVLVLLVPAGVRVRRRRRRTAAGRHGDAEALWAELSDTAADLGYVWSAARSPRQVAVWLGKDAVDSRGALDSIVAAVERQRFGGAVATVGAGSELADGLGTVRDELAGQRSLHTRLAARFWPSSLGWTPQHWARALRKH